METTFRMKSIFNYVLLLIVCLLLSCNKNQKLTNKLDGNWKLNSLYISDQNIETELNRFIFSSCSLKKNQKCPLQVELKDGEMLKFDYTVDRQKNLLFISSEGSSSILKYSITSLTNNVLVLSRPYIDQDGNEYPDVKAEYFFHKNK